MRPVRLEGSCPNEMELKERVLSSLAEPSTEAAEQAFDALIAALNEGRVRAASRDGHGNWRVHSWVKEGLVLGFRMGRIEPVEKSFYDKHTFPLKPLSMASGVRLVPGGSAVRTGVYLASGVICMPPMYINTGAYVDENTMIDSHALVGSCAQIGRRVHLSAAAQVGGVLEPPGAMPVIIEDDVFIGGGCGIYEGCIVREKAVLAPGVILTGALQMYDLVNEEVIPAKEVPPRAVVVPGTRAVKSSFAKTRGLSLYAPVIVKYRDAKTDAGTALENALR